MTFIVLNRSYTPASLVRPRHDGRKKSNVKKVKKVIYLTNTNMQHKRIVCAMHTAPYPTPLKRAIRCFQELYCYFIDYMCVLIFLKWEWPHVFSTVNNVCGVQSIVHVYFFCAHCSRVSENGQDNRDTRKEWEWGSLNYLDRSSRDFPGLPWGQQACHNAPTTKYNTGLQSILECFYNQW